GAEDVHGSSVSGSGVADAVDGHEALDGEDLRRGVEPGGGDRGSEDGAECGEGLLVAPDVDDADSGGGAVAQVGQPVRLGVDGCPAEAEYLLVLFGGPAREVPDCCDGHGDAASRWCGGAVTPSTVPHVGVPHMGERHPAWPRLWVRATSASSIRSRAPSLRVRAATCFSTVLGDR